MAEAGIRYKNRTDVLLALMDKGTAVARRHSLSRNAPQRRSNGAAPS